MEIEEQCRSAPMTSTIVCRWPVRNGSLDRYMLARRCLVADATVGRPLLVLACRSGRTEKLLLSFPSLRFCPLQAVGVVLEGRWKCKCCTTLQCLGRESRMPAGPACEANTNSIAASWRSSSTLGRKTERNESLDLVGDGAFGADSELVNRCATFGSPRWQQELVYSSAVQKETLRAQGRR